MTKHGRGVVRALFAVGPLVCAVFFVLTSGRRAVLHAQSGFNFVHFFPWGGYVGSPTGGNGGLLVDSDGTFYGTAVGQGTRSAFAVRPGDQFFWSSHIPDVNAVATSECLGSPLTTDQEGRESSERRSHRRFYGVTYDGGAFQRGSIFSVEANLQTGYRTLYEFNYTNGAYPLGPLLLMAFIRRDHGIRPYIWLLTGIGISISTYHVLIERFPSLETGACEVSNPCSIKWVEKFGFVTLPVMAWLAFASIAAVTWLAGPATTGASVGTREAS